MPRTTFTPVALALTLGLLGTAGVQAAAQLMTKPQVANLIKNVENGVDDFREYLEKRGEKAGDKAEKARATPPASGASGRRAQPATDAQKEKARGKADELDEKLDDLNKSTNRLRRKFDATDKWIETKNQVEEIVEDGREINTVVARGTYGAEAAKLWAVLRAGINDLARAYGVTPMAV